jgi:hypothetical protein
VSSSTSVVDDATTLDVALDGTTPQVAFTVTTTAQAASVFDAGLRADVRVDDDGDPANDGVRLLDVGLVEHGAGLPVDVDVAGDAAMASVGEGAFGVVTRLDPVAVIDGAVTDFVVRLRPDASRARVTVQLRGSIVVEGGAPATVTVDVAPRADDAAPAAEEP